MLKLEGKQVEDHPVVMRLVELRAVCGFVFLLGLNCYSVIILGEGVYMYMVPNSEYPVNWQCCTLHHIVVAVA